MFEIVTDENQVRVELTTRTSAVVHWPDHLDHGSGVHVTVERVTKENVIVDTHNWTVDGGETNVTLTHLTAGQQYRVNVRGVSTDEELTTRFRAGNMTSGRVEHKATYRGIHCVDNARTAGTSW